MAYRVLEVFCYYRIKKYIKHKLFIRRLIREDAAKKKQILAEIDEISGNQLSRKGDESDIIVSLTSYGIRVNDTLPFTLYSLIKQTRKPNRIVVWLDNVNWSEEKLPPVLKKLQALGIEFYFVEDLRSYKKLIPALYQFPDNVIITVDDDLYYNPSTIEWLIEAYEKSDKHSVIGTWAYDARAINGQYLLYSQWKNGKEGRETGEYSLIGCGGILYPPHIFDDEILKKELFMKMAPTADDLWFWVMEKRQTISVQLISGAKYGLHESVNRIDAWEPNREGSLYYINELNGANDKQFSELLSYYELSPSLSE